MAVETLWDASKGLPAPNAWFANNRGDSKKTGNFICWPKNGAVQTSKDVIKCCIPGGGINAEDCYIAKVYMPYVRETPFDYKKFREFPVDLNDRMNERRCERKIGRILQNLGVAYVDRAGLLYTTNDIAVSAWFTNYQGKEGIALNPYVLLQTNMQYLTRLVKKEVVHRALYRNLSELSNKVILNFTLDVLSMRVIAQTPYEKLDKITVRLAEKLFVPKDYSKKFPLMVLCDPSLTPDQVKRTFPTAIANIWCELYEPDKRGFLPSLKEIKPSALYFKIKGLIDDIFVTSIQQGAMNPLTPTNYPFNVTPSNEINKTSYNDDTVSTQFDKKNEALNNATRDSFKPRKFKNNRSWNNSVTQFWDEQVIQKKDFVEETLKEFAKKWRTEKLLEEMEGKLQQIVGRDEVELKPYAEDLTYDGTIMMALGISSPEVLPLYWNKDDSETNNRKKVAAFFDLSPSMQNMLPYMVRIVESVEETCDCSFMRNQPDAEGGTVRGAYGFSGSVRDISEDELEQMKKGKFKTGASTSFDEVLSHVLKKIKEDNLDIIIIFTDGESGIANNENIKEFNESGKKMFKIYMTPFYGDNRGKTKITSDLDKLNGDAFTLCLPPLDKF